jgi:anti-sigma regulatory factor (Ser/Thr protein kinase)
VSLSERRVFQPVLTEVRAVRKFVSDRAVLWGVQDLAGSSTLVASELAANAVMHARSPFSVYLQHNDHRIIVEVADDNPRLPTVEDPPPGALSGRGLPLVQALATRWGVREVPDDGKVVWAELVRDDSASCDGPAAAEGASATSTSAEGSGVAPDPRR